MQAYVYKSRRKADTYVYLRQREDFESLPEPVRAGLGELEFVLELALTPQRKLAREDVATVRANLTDRGFHLQLPPSTVAPVAVDRLGDMAVLAGSSRPSRRGVGDDDHGDV